MRAWHKLAITVVVLAGLFVAADRIAVGVADGMVAKKIQTAGDLNVRPGVSIKGFPFLTQVLAKKLDNVQLSAEGLQVTAGGKAVTLRTFSAHVSGVRVNSSFSSATADTATGSALISYTDLSALIGHDATVSYAGNGKIKIVGSVDLPVVGEVDGNATAKLAVVDGDTLKVTDLSVGTLGGGIDIGDLPDTGAVFGSLVNTSEKLAGLPVGLSLQGVQLGPDGVTITMAGHNLDLAG